MDDTLFKGIVDLIELETRSLCSKSPDKISLAHMFEPIARILVGKVYCGVMLNDERSTGT